VVWYFVKHRENYFMYIIYICVCVCERERERGGDDTKLFWVRGQRKRIHGPHMP